MKRYLEFNFKDLLVVNFEGDANDITTEKYGFDVDGKINDGTEMFGTRIGDGFSNLIVQNIDI